MADLNDWDVTAANNNDAPPDGWPENTMNYSDVNNTGREGMGVLARFYKDANGSLQFAGVADAYTLTLNAPYVAYFAGMYFAAEINLTNTGGTTIDVNGIGVQTVLDSQGAAIPAGVLVAGGIYEFRYDGTNFQLMGFGVAADLELDSLVINDVSTIDLTDAIAPLVISPGSGQHLELDGNEMQSKSDATTAATLALNSLGGVVNIGAQSGSGTVNLWADGTLRLGTTTVGIDVLGTAIDLDNSSAATATELFIRNSEGGFKIKIDGDATEFWNTNSAGAEVDQALGLDTNGIDVSIYPAMTVAPASADSILYDDGGVTKTMSYAESAKPVNTDADTHTFVDADVGAIRVYTGGTSTHAWTLNTGIGQQGCAIVVANDGTTDGPTLTAGSATIETSAPGLVVKQDGVAVLVNIGSDVWKATGDLTS